LDIRVDEEYLKKIRESLGESLATRHIDYTRIKEMAEKAKEYRLIPEYVEEFFKKAFQKAGGRFKIRKDKFITIDSVPYDLRKIAEEVDFKNRYGKLLQGYTKATFDKEIAFKNSDAEFISFGHPLLEALLEWIDRNYFGVLQKGAVFEDPEGKYNGTFWFFEGEVKDGRGNVAGKRLLAIYDNGVELKGVNPAVLWDFVPIDNSSTFTSPIPNKEKALDYAINLIENYKNEILEERKRQGEIKKKYGIRSLEHIIEKLDLELIQLNERKEKGGNVDIAIKNKEERKKHYENAKKKLQIEIEREISLSCSMPKFLGAILVRPSSSPEMVSDEEIEKIGMEIAINYEKSQGRVPFDVSKENLGYDIKSKSEGEIRYIEVKARKDEGQIVLTPNEWLKAKRFKEQYWLYVVSNAVKNPTLYIINNPAENLNVQEKVEIVRFIVPFEEWKNKGEKV
jgi:hypothetical protein